MVKQGTLNSLSTEDLVARQEALIAHPEHSWRVNDEIDSIDRILFERFPPVDSTPTDAELEDMYRRAS